MLALAPITAPLGLALLTLVGTAHAADFVALRDVAPGIVQAMHYATPTNFTGAVVPGYLSVVTAVEVPVSSRHQRPLAVPACRALPGTGALARWNHEAIEAILAQIQDPSPRYQVLPVQWCGQQHAAHAPSQLS